MKKRVLILCTGNSCRSQMAEGWWRHLAGAEWDVFSAGLLPQGVNPWAIKVMEEVGVDISSHTSDSIDDYIDQPFDLIVTVCSNADRACPAFPNASVKEHWPFVDPAEVEGSDDELLTEFRTVRDRIGERVRTWLQSQ